MAIRINEIAKSAEFMVAAENFSNDLTQAIASPRREGCILRLPAAMRLARLEHLAHRGLRDEQKIAKPDPGSRRLRDVGMPTRFRGSVRESRSENQGREIRNAQVVIPALAIHDS